MSDESRKDEDVSRSDSMKPMDGFGLLVGFAIGWLLFDSFFWAMLFGVLFGLAFSSGRRAIGR